MEQETFDSMPGTLQVREFKIEVEWRDGKPVKLGDIADVKVAPGKRQSFAYQNGNPALGFRIVRETGANVLATVNAVKEELAKINDGPAKEQGVTLQYSFDPSHFIDQSIEMLTRDLILGILLAVGVLWFFMREWRATLIISAAIPGQEERNADHLLERLIVAPAHAVEAHPLKSRTTRLWLLLVRLVSSIEVHQWCDGYSMQHD